MVDVKTTIVACYNSWLAGVICQVADGIATCYNSWLAGVICHVVDEIATVGWMCMLDGISIGRWNSQGSVQFSLSSEVLNRISSHICGRWNLPMVLLRDGLLTLINNDSFIALLRFWSSPHYTKILNGDIVTSGVKMVKYWGGCLLMFLEPLSKNP